jgi:hypothetical protein
MQTSCFWFGQENRIIIKIQRISWLRCPSPKSGDRGHAFRSYEALRNGVGPRAGSELVGCESAGVVFRFNFTP